MTTEPKLKLRRCCAADLAAGDRLLWRTGTAQVLAVGDRYTRELMMTDMWVDGRPGGTTYERRTYLTLTLRRDDGVTETYDLDALRRDLRQVTA